MLTFDGTSRNTGFGISAVDQINDQFAEATSVSLAPDTLNATFTVSSTMNVPNTNLGLQVRVPVAVGVTYNPHTVAAIGVVDLALLGAAGYQALATIFGTGGALLGAGAH